MYCLESIGVCFFMSEKSGFGQRGSDTFGLGQRFPEFVGRSTLKRAIGVGFRRKSSGGWGNLLQCKVLSLMHAPKTLHSKPQLHTERSIEQPSTAHCRLRPVSVLSVKLCLFTLPEKCSISNPVPIAGKCGKITSCSCGIKPLQLATCSQVQVRWTNRSCSQH